MEPRPPGVRLPELVAALSHSSDLALGQPMEHDLVDRFELMIYGIVLGTGKRLFKEGSPRRSLRLVEGRASKTGVLMATYEPER